MIFLWYVKCSKKSYLILLLICLLRRKSLGDRLQAETDSGVIRQTGSAHGSMELTFQLKKVGQNLAKGPFIIYRQGGVEILRGPLIFGKLPMG